MSSSKGFYKQLKIISDKYGEQILSLSGIGKEQLDYNSFMDKFILSKNTADSSIDANSNVSMTDETAMLEEMFKPQKKILSLQILYNEMKKEWGKEQANTWLEKEISGEIYMHDAFESAFKPYCYNYSLQDIIKKGMFFDETLKANSPKHLDSFNQHILEFVGYATKRQSGAVGLGDYLVWSYYFWRNDRDTGYMGITDFEKYKHQQFQMFVYAANQSWAKNTQSAFTNVSLFLYILLISMLE